MHKNLSILSQVMFVQTGDSEFHSVKQVSAPTKWHNLKKTQYAKKCILMKITRVNPYESNQDIIAGTQNCTSMYLLLEYFFQY